MSPWVLVYFVSLVIFGSFFLVNLALAVLYLQFSKEFSLIPGSAANSRYATQEQQPFTPKAADAAAASLALTGQAGAGDSYAGSSANSAVAVSGQCSGNSSSAGWKENASLTGGCDGAVVAEVTVSKPALAYSRSGSDSATAQKQDGQVHFASCETAGVDAVPAGQGNGPASTTWQPRQRQMQQLQAEPAVPGKRAGSKQQCEQDGVQRQAQSCQSNLQQMLMDAEGTAASCWAGIRRICSTITEVRCPW